MVLTKETPLEGLQGVTFPSELNKLPKLTLPPYLSTGKAKISRYELTRIRQMSQQKEASAE